jgi:cyanophycinase-like exopeptidase
MIAATAAGSDARERIELAASHAAEDLGGLDINIAVFRNSSSQHVTAISSAARTMASGEGVSAMQ